MGYTHYWYREEAIDKNTFKSIKNDFVKVYAHSFIKLASGSGQGQPELTTRMVCFNGFEKCGHKKSDLGITWPSENAGGVSSGENERTKISDGSWFAGAKLTTRTCGGDCSHESVDFPIKLEKDRFIQKNDSGLNFNFCKTAYKPYDLLVTAFLIIAKHYLKDSFKVSSDGTNNDWFDGALLCHTHLGYGLEFKI